MKNFQIINQFIAEQVEVGEIEGEKISLKENGTLLYKNAKVAFFNFEEGTVSSRMEFGNNRDDAAWLRRLVKNAPAMMNQAHEII